MEDKNLLDLLQSEGLDLTQRSSNWYEGPCPVCGGDNRFVVKPNSNHGKGGFTCRSCWNSNNPPIRPEYPRSGGFVDYYMFVKGMTYQEAKTATAKYLSGVVDEAIDRVDKPRKIEEKTSYIAPGDSWQDKLDRIVYEAIHRLDGEDGGVYDYLLERGLSTRTINTLQYGAMHSSTAAREYLGSVDELKELNTWFVVIPWYYKKLLWKVELRDINPTAKIRYRNVSKSAEGLYLADCLKKKRPTFIVESSFCAAVIAQEAGDLVNVVATGGTDRAKISQWVMRLSRMPVIFQSFDNDQAGENHSEYWMKALAHTSPIRWRPIVAKDPNAMHLYQPGLVRKWVEEALIYACDHNPNFTPEKPVTNNSPLCATCLDNGVETLAIEIPDKDGYLYCSKHQPTITPEIEKPGHDLEATEEKQHQQIEQWVSLAVEKMPGWNIEVVRTSDLRSLIDAVPGTLVTPEMLLKFDDKPVYLTYGDTHCIYWEWVRDRKGSYDIQQHCKLKIDNGVYCRKHALKVGCSK